MQADYQVACELAYGTSWLDALSVRQINTVHIFADDRWWSQFFGDDFFVLLLLVCSRYWWQAHDGHHSDHPDTEA